MWCCRSSDHAVNRISWRSIAASVCSSTSGNWIAWLRASGRPQVMPLLRVRHRLVDAELRRRRATTRPAGSGSRARSAARARARGRPSRTRADAGTRTSRSVTSAWSVGMLNVHQKKSTLKPSASVGTRNAVMPTGEPGSPDVRGEHDVVRRVVQPGVEPLRAVDHPLVAVARRPWSRGRSRRSRGSARSARTRAGGCRRGSRASTRLAARRCRSRASSARSGSCRRSSSRSAGRCAARGPSSRGARG